MAALISEFAILVPACIAAFVRFTNAVVAATCIAENLTPTVSVSLPICEKVTLFAADVMFSKPVATSFNFNFSLSLSNVDILVATFLSKLRLSNLISATLLSINVLMKR